MPCSQIKSKVISPGPRLRKWTCISRKLGDRNVLSLWLQLLRSIFIVNVHHKNDNKTNKNCPVLSDRRLVSCLLWCHHNNSLFMFCEAVPKSTAFSPKGQQIVSPNQTEQRINAAAGERHFFSVCMTHLSSKHKLSGFSLMWTLICMQHFWQPLIHSFAFCSNHSSEPWCFLYRFPEGMCKHLPESLAMINLS